MVYFALSNIAATRPHKKGGNMEYRSQRTIGDHHIEFTPDGRLRIISSAGKEIINFSQQETDELARNLYYKVVEWRLTEKEEQEPTDILDEVEEIIDLFFFDGINYIVGY